MLKRCTIVPLFLLAGLASWSAPRTSLKDSATVIIRLDNFCNRNEPIDSVYLIFDRCDRTGAGVVRRVFHPVNNALEIRVPKGKYYINVFCLGNYRDKHFDIVRNLKSRRINELRLKVDPSYFYIPGFVSIPEEKIDFGNLSITSFSFLNK